ncbi:MAG: hypothetical protein ACREIC_05255, partial [Limisphaerales bacterium]
MKTEILTWCDQTVAATATGVYQGILLTILVALGLRILGRTNAATRHTIWLATLFLLAGILAAHYCLDDPGRAPQAPTEDSMKAKAGERQPSPAADAPVAISTVNAATHATSLESRSDDVAVSEGAVAPINLRERRLAAGPPVPASEPPELEMLVLPAVTSHPASPPANEPPVISEPVRSAGWPGWVWERLRSALAGFSKPVSWSLPSGWSLPRIAGDVALGAWAIIGLARLMALALRLGEIRKLKRASKPASDGLREVFDSLRAHLGLKREVRLLVSPAHSS